MKTSFLIILIASAIVPSTLAKSHSLANLKTTNKQLSGEALIEATKKGRLETVKLLLSQGVDPNAVVHTNTALTFSARDGYLEIAQTLINYGADVNWVDGEGVTPLILAAFKGHVTLVKLLLEHKANTKIRDQWNRTAMDYAVRRGEEDEIVQLLKKTSL